MRAAAAKASRRTPRQVRLLSSRGPLPWAPASAAGKQGQRVRDFQWESLYSPEFGYFATRTVVGHTPEPIDFRAMKGQQEWFQKLRELYRLDTGGKHAGEQDARASEVWFTPAELFRPHYSRAMAAAVLAMYEHGVAISLQAAAAAPESASPGAVAGGLSGSALRQSRQAAAPARRRRAGERASARGRSSAGAVGARGPARPAAPRLRVFELGAGNGTNAVHMLDHIRRAAPAAYDACELWAVEVSEVLSARQSAALAAAGHGAKLRTVRSDATRLQPDMVKPQGPTVDVVVATEVLDNLPHDKAAWMGGPAQLVNAAEGLAALLLRLASEAAGAGGAARGCAVSEHSAPLLAASEISRAAAAGRLLVGLLGRPAGGLSEAEAAVAAACAPLLRGWALVRVAEAATPGDAPASPAGQTDRGGVAWREQLCPLFPGLGDGASAQPCKAGGRADGAGPAATCWGEPSDRLAAEALLSLVLAPAVASRMAPGAASSSSSSSPSAVSAAAASASAAAASALAGDVTAAASRLVAEPPAPRGTAFFTVLAEGLEAVRGKLQTLLYSEEEQEAPDGPWLPRARRAAPSSPSAALRGHVTAASRPPAPPSQAGPPAARAGSDASERPGRSAALQGSPQQGIARSAGTPPPPFFVPVPIAAGDTTRPLGETATLPALSLGADILKAASKAPAAAATMAQGPSLAVMLPSAALRLVTALHTALPGHGLIAADFHALPLQRGGPTAPAGAAGLVAESSVASTRWYARSDSRSPAAADVPEGFSRVEPHAHHDVACVDVDPPAGTVNPAVVQSRDVDLDGSGPGASAGEEAGRGAAGRGRDHASYLSPHPRGRADIFFATDFAGLAAAWCGGAAGGAAASADVAWQPHLLDATGVADEGRTRSGFNPLLHDYANTSVLLGWPYRA